VRKRLTIGSGWKMNKTRAEARAFVEELRGCLGSYRTELIRAYVLPPFTALETVHNALVGYPLELGAQDMFWADSGAYTGEVSPLMLADLNCTIVMLGHSERRSCFGETDEFLNRKVKAALRHGMTPLICIGETREEWQSGRAEATLRHQLQVILAGVSAMDVTRLMTLYEPRWAIGQSEAASPDYIQGIHATVRQMLGDLYDQKTARVSSILYGGSVNIANLEAILRLPDVDGAGVGRAAWDAAGFAAMIRLAEEVSLTKLELYGLPEVHTDQGIEQHSKQG
jgi:triosephosphate isomerase